MHHLLADVLEHPAPVRGYWNVPQFPDERHAIDRFQVCTIEEAQKLVEEIDAVENAAGRGQVVNAREDETATYFWDPDEQRRIWVLTLPGGTRMFAGQLLKWKYSFGVGAPGRWVDITGHQPVWVHELGPQPLADIRPPREVPIRALKDNERIVDLPFGPSVFRTDLAPAASSAGLTTEQAKQLSTVLSTVTKLETQVSQLVPA